MLQGIYEIKLYMAISCFCYSNETYSCRNSPILVLQNTTMRHTRMTGQSAH